MRKAMNGFRHTGIYPTDSHIFEDSDFDASHVTDIPEEHTSSEVGQTLLPLGQTSSALGQTSSAVSQTSSAVGQTLPSLGNTSSAVAQNSVGQTSSAVGQTLSSLGNTSSAVAQTSVGQTSSAAGQTLPSLGQTSSFTGQVARSLTSSNRATYVLANELSPIPIQTHAGVRRGGARGKTVVITSGPYKAYMSSKAKVKRLPCKKTVKLTKG